MTTKIRFKVDLGGEAIAPYEVVGVFGELKELGSWCVQKAPLLKRSQDYNVWTGHVVVPCVASLRYRYFVAAVDKHSKVVQIRRWETHAEARTCYVNADFNKCSDKFGWIDEYKREVHRGWLNVGKIVIFKLFNEVLELEMSPKRTEQLRLKLEIVDPELKLPIASSARAHVQYTCLKYGNSVLQEQPDHGIIYESGDVLIFHTILISLSKVAFRFQLYSTDERTNFVRNLGHQYVLPQNLKGSEGELSLKLVLPSWTSSVAALKMQYLIVTPMRNWRVRLASTLLDYWPKCWKGLDIGHRGLGASYTNKKPAPLTENTIRSIIESYNAGFDMAEFNVQLTKDLVPIVFNDFNIMVSKEDFPATREDLIEIDISKMSYWDLKSQKIYKIVEDRVIEYPPANSILEEIDQLFPMLESVYNKTNKMLGFNIEIKWPQTLFSGVAESSQTIDKNKYVDKILEVVKRFGWGRVCFFSSYDADMCAMLAYKQNIYPVFFIVPDIMPLYRDPRAHCLLSAVNMAQAFELTGVVQSVECFSQYEYPVEIARRQNKRVMLWGEMLCDRDEVEQFKAEDVDAVISSCFDVAMVKMRYNRFETDADLQHLLGMQETSKFF